VLLPVGRRLGILGLSASIFVVHLPRTLGRVVERRAWGAGRPSSWMALAGAPCIAECEQNVWRRMCTLPSPRDPLDAARARPSHPRCDRVRVSRRPPKPLELPPRTRGWGRPRRSHRPARRQIPKTIDSRHIPRKPRLGQRSCALFSDERRYVQGARPNDCDTFVLDSGAQSASQFMVRVTRCHVRRRCLSAGVTL
jgi:hypothetical protein